jgi:2-polyprenyl-3-methyl-5-hydroxy-6-metoxy-1,4-benzoquinol methylase
MGSGNTSLTWGSSYDRGRQSQERLDKILSHTDLPGTVLDLGANVGFFAHGMAKAGFDVVAAEPPNKKTFDLDLVSEYRKWVQRSEDLPDGPFDYTLVLSVVHHIPAWQDVLEGVYARTTRASFVEVPARTELHSQWHGSRESYEYLVADSRAEIIGSYTEVSGHTYRDLWKVNLS